jgi:hypothetical protein
MHGYIIVSPEGALSSSQRAEQISRELYCLTAPLATQEPYQSAGKVFGVVEHPDTVQFALQVHSDYNIPVNALATLEPLIALLPEMTEVEEGQLAAQVFNSQSFLFGDAIPSAITVSTQEEMTALGWFPEEL